MPTFLAGFSGSGNYRARLETNETGGWALYGDKLAGSGFWTSDAQGWAVSINGQNWSGAYTYDYRGTSSILIASGSYNRPALTSTFGASASVNMDSGIGNASPSGSFTAYGTATAPDAPTGVSIDQIAPSSLRYIFSGNGNGGAAIDQWQAQVASDSAFTANLQTVTSSGTTTFTSLTPATTYYCRSRGHNAVGWGGWSNTLSAMTSSGAYVSVNGIWIAVPVYVSNGTAWLGSRVQASDGTTWKDAL